MDCSVSNVLVKADQVCDYVPFLSSVNNLVDIFLKYVFLPLLSEESVKNSHYYTHLQEKSFTRLTFLLIPIISNLFYASSDFEAAYEKKLKALALQQVQNGVSLTDVDAKYRNDREIALAAMQENPEDFLSLSEEFRNDPEIAAIAFDKNPIQAAQYLGDKLRKNAAFLTPRVPLMPSFYLGYYLRESCELQENKDFVLAALAKDKMLFRYASRELQRDREICLAASSKR